MRENESLSELVNDIRLQRKCEVWDHGGVTLPGSDTLNSPESWKGLILSPAVQKQAQPGALGAAYSWRRLLSPELKDKQSQVGTLVPVAMRQAWAGKRGLPSGPQRPPLRGDRHLLWRFRHWAARPTTPGCETVSSLDHAGGQQGCSRHLISSVCWHGHSQHGLRPAKGSSSKSVTLALQEAWLPPASSGQDD